MGFVLKTMWRWLWGQCGGGYGVNVEVAMGRQTDLVLYASSRSIKIMVLDMFGVRHGLSCLGHCLYDLDQGLG